MITRGSGGEDVFVFEDTSCSSATCSPLTMFCRQKVRVPGWLGIGGEDYGPWELRELIEMGKILKERRAARRMRPKPKQKKKVIRKRRRRP